MAALEKIRSNGKIVMAIVFLALLCFVVGDALTNSSAFFNKNREQIGEVYGKKLSYTDFQKDVDAFTTFNKIQGTYSSDANVRNEAWQTYVLENVMKDQAEKIGMYVTTEELNYYTKEVPHPMVQSVRMLQDESGKFSKKVLNDLLVTFKRMEEMSDEDKENNPRYEDLNKLYNSWICVEKKLNNMLLYEKYFRMVSAATTAPKAEKKFIEQYTAETADYVVAFKPFATMSDSAYTVSPAEAKAKYNELQKRFKTEAYRTVKAIVFDVKPLAADSDEAMNRAASVERELKDIETAEEAILLAVQECDPSIYNRNVFLTKDEVDLAIKDFAFSANKGAILSTFQDGNFYKTAKIIESAVNRPDSVKVSCIYLKGKAKKELEATIDSLQDEIKKGAKFADLAEKHTMDASSKAEKGVLGWFSEGIFTRLKDFDSKVFAAKVGEIFEMEDRGEFFLIKVDSISATSSQKVKVAEVAIKIESSTDTHRKYYESASKYLGDNNTLESFTENALDQNLFVQEYSVQKDDNTIGNIENGRKIINWAFNEDCKVGDIVAQPFESANQCVIVALSGAVEKGYAPYSVKEVKNIVDNAVRNDKKATEIINEWSGKEINALVGTALDTMRNVRFDSERIEPAILGVLPSLKADDQSAPFKGSNGVYTIKVLSKNAVDAEHFENRYKTMQYMYNQTFSILMDKAQITDNRSVFF